MNIVPIALAAILALAFTACSSSTDDGGGEEKEPRPRGERVLVIDLNEADGESFDAVVARARSVGASGANLSIGWEDIETAPGVYSPAVDLLAIAESYFPGVDLSILLMIGPIDTNVERLPSDLKGKPFDDPEVIQRYRDLLDHVFEKIPTLQLDAFAVGNEVDFYLADDVEAWTAYTEFYEAARDHIATIRPDLPVGVKVTHAGLTGPFAAEAARLNRESDLILTTHYPLGEAYQVDDPVNLVDDFGEIVDRYPTRPIRFAELGYPSSSVNGSSEEKQALFVRATFRAWDTYADRITAISFSIMTDRSQASVDEFAAYYGVDEREFTEFIRTLGLRRFDGSEKEAWEALVEESEARGW